MKVIYAEDFLKRYSKLKDKGLSTKIARAIADLENANSISEIRNIKKLSGASGMYRIRIGDYRIGIEITDNEISLLAFGH